jgi:hypothetical protein
MTPATPPWRSAIRDVLLVAALVVGVVLGAVVLTSALPQDVQRLVFHTPLAIGVLVVVTAWILWRIARQQPPAA